MVALLIQASALIQALAFTTLILLVIEHLTRKEITKMEPNNVHVAYLRRLRMVMIIRSTKMRALQCTRFAKTAAAKTRAANKARACSDWERFHA